MVHLAYDSSPFQNHGTIVSAEWTNQPLLDSYEISGCTDEQAENFNNFAIYDDNSCMYDLRFLSIYFTSFLLFWSTSLINGWPINEGDRIIAYKADSNGWPTGDPIGGNTWNGAFSDSCSNG